MMNALAFGLPLLALLVGAALLRAGMELAAALWLGAGPWIWVVPAGVVALVALKWLARPGADDDDDAPD